MTWEEIAKLHRLNQVRWQMVAEAFEEVEEAFRTLAECLEATSVVTAK
jgi:hypothetical protein